MTDANFGCGALTLGFNCVLADVLENLWQHRFRAHDLNQSLGASTLEGVYFVHTFR